MKKKISSEKLAFYALFGGQITFRINGNKIGSVFIKNKNHNNK